MGLKHDCNCPFRVYVLLCAGSRYYAGISPVGKFEGRIQKHFAGSSAHYRRVHKPRVVLMAWPALLESVEAMVYFTMQQKLFQGGKGDCGRLGGWVQTSSNPPPPVRGAVRADEAAAVGQVLRLWRRQALCGLAQLFGRG